MPKLTATPGAVRWPGREAGADTRTVLSAKLGLSAEELDALEAAQVIGTVSGRHTKAPDGLMIKRASTTPRE